MKGNLRDIYIHYPLNERYFFCTCFLLALCLYFGLIDTLKFFFDVHFPYLII